MPDYAFNDGVLTIHAAAWDLRLIGRPRPTAEERLPGQKIWHPCWPELRVFRAADAPADETDDGGKTATFAALRAIFPPELPEWVAPFRSHHWPLLALLHDLPPAQDLARSNPALAFALANHAEFHPYAPETCIAAARGRVNRRQRETLHWLGFPEQEAVARVFRKIAAPAVSPARLRALAGALGRAPELLTTLSHLPRINADVLELAGDYYLRAWISPNLLAELAEDRSDDGATPMADALREALHLFHTLDALPPARPLTRAAAIRALRDEANESYLAAERRRLEAEAAAARRREQRQAAAARRREREQAAATAAGFPTRAAWNAAQRQEREARRLRAMRERNALMMQAPMPPPPLQGTEHIVPLCTDEDLRQEGAAQHNCVGSYGLLVRSGKLFVYRVLHPERATLAIVRGADGAWHWNEIETAHNGPVSVATKKAVEQWLWRNQVSV